MTANPPFPVEPWAVREPMLNSPLAHTLPGSP